MFIWIFIYHRLFHWSWKVPMGSGQLRIHAYVYNSAALLQSLSHLAANSICFKVVRDPCKVFQPCPYNFRFDEDWDVRLPESPLPLLRVGVLVVWFDPCSDNSDAFDDRNALISITRAITRGDRRFSVQDGGQAFFDNIASWVYDLVPCFPDQAKSIWLPINADLCTK